MFACSRHRRMTAREGSLAASTFQPMNASLAVVDCPKCQGRGTVVLGICPVCMVCFSEFSEEDETISRGGTESDPLW